MTRKINLELIRTHLDLDDEDLFGDKSMLILEYLDKAEHPEPFSCIFEAVGKRMHTVKRRGIKGKLRYLVGLGVLVAYEADREIKHAKITPEKIEDGAILFAINPKFR